MSVCLGLVYFALCISLSRRVRKKCDTILNDCLSCFAVRDDQTVKHYRIRQLDEGGFFIARRTTFRTLQELVVHYARDPDGLCVNLQKPCIQVIFLSIINSWLGQVLIVGSIDWLIDWLIDFSVSWRITDYLKCLILNDRFSSPIFLSPHRLSRLIVHFVPLAGRKANHQWPVPQHRWPVGDHAWIPEVCPEAGLRPVRWCLWGHLE